MRQIKWIVLGLFVLRVVFAFLTYHPDVWNHMDWGIRFFDYGPQTFYSPEANVWSYTWPNQPPGTTLMFAGIYQIFLFVFAILTWINQHIPPFPSTVMFFFEQTLYPALLKLPAILSDFGIAYLIYKILKEHKAEKLGRLGALMFLVNPAIWFNSAVWGQYDAVINFLCLLAFYLLVRKKVTPAFIALALSLYIKLSLAIFIPVFIVLLIRERISLGRIVKAFLVTAAIFGAITLLFSFPNDPFTWLFNLYTKKILVQQLHVITANAFNLWAALTGIHEQPDSLKWGSFSYQMWGYILYVPIYLYSLYRILKSKREVSIYVWMAVIAFASFMLMTNMHERYIFPLFPYFTIIATITPSLRAIYWAVSGISLLNLYNFWFTPRIESIVKVMEFDNRLMPRIMGLINFLLFVLLTKHVVQSSSRK